MPTGVCPHCGAKMVEYRHGLSEPLVVALARLLRAGGRANLDALGLTRNQWDNFQKLRYFGLVRQVEVDGKRKRGVWEVTSEGEAFVTGRLAIHSAAWTYRGERVRWDGTEVYVGDVVGGYQQREEWAREAAPVPSHPAAPPPAAAPTKYTCPVPRCREALADVEATNSIYLHATCPIHGRVMVRRNGGS